MRLLLDTHAFLWWVVNDRQLSHAAREAIADDSNDVLVSAASAWEITTRHRIGKLPEAESLAENIVSAVASEGFEGLSVTVSDAAQAGSLAGPLRDPFDRMLIAQASSRNLVVISNESLFDKYNVQRIW